MSDQPPGYQHPPYTKDVLAQAIARGWAVVGDHSYGAPTIRYPGFGRKFICGKYCSIADKVEIFIGGYHRPDWVSMYPFPAFQPHWPGAKGIPGFAVAKGDVTVGHDVWIGSAAMLMSGVSVGHGAVIAARSVVTHDIPPFAVAGGNPARVVRFRFDEAVVAALLRIAWWDWPEEKVHAEVGALLSGDIVGFVSRHDALFRAELGLPE